MKNTKLVIAMLAIVGAAFASCKKEKSEAPVPAPSSNVKSFTFNTNSNAWTQKANVFSATLLVEDITSDVLSKGTVNIFIGDGTGSNWISMPVTLYEAQWSNNISFQSVKINAEMSIKENTAFINPGVQQFKVVVVSGS